MLHFLKNFIKKILQIINIFYLQLNKKKIIFYHIPRTSGTSIKFFFIKHFGEKNIFGSNDFRTFNESEVKNKNILFGHKIYSKLNFKNKYEFTILRNPIERDLSLFNYYMNYNLANKNKNKDSIIKELNYDISNYIEIIKNNYQDNIITRFFSNKYPIKDFNLFFGNKENNFISLENKLKKINKKQTLNKVFNLQEEDCKKAIKNLNTIDIWLLENLNRKKLYKKFDALIYFNDNFQVNKSIKTVELNSEKKKMIESINKYDLRIYDYFKNK